jgi:hypothetical protein
MKRQKLDRKDAGAQLLNLGLFAGFLLLATELLYNRINESQTKDKILLTAY